MRSMCIVSSTEGGRQKVDARDHVALILHKDIDVDSILLCRIKAIDSIRMSSIVVMLNEYRDPCIGVSR